MIIFCKFRCCKRKARRSASVCPLAPMTGSFFDFFFVLLDLELDVLVDALVDALVVALVLGSSFDEISREVRFGMMKAKSIEKERWKAENG